MAKLGINTGSTADDGTGDSLRVGAGKINSNFNEDTSLAFEIEHMSSYYTDAANLHEYEGHTLYHARFIRKINDTFKTYIRVENMFDKAYAERADFNAFGGDRYFPGLPREFYIGLEYIL